MHATIVFKSFKNKNIVDYHNLYVLNDILLLTDVFENFRNKSIEIYELDPAHFLSALGLAWEACLKKPEIELELFTDIDMLLMVEKGIRGGICNAIRRYAKANNKYIKTCDRNIYKDISRDVEKRFDTSNYGVKRPLSTIKNKLIGLMEDELGVKIMRL